MKLFFDANVLFTAAHNPSGKASFIIEFASPSNWNVVTCELAKEEARRNLEMKFPNSLSRFHKLFKTIKLVPTVTEGDCPIALPTKDQPIFLSAKYSKCTHLLTGDLRDFGKFMNQPKKSNGIIIQTVADFLRSV